MNGALRIKLTKRSINSLEPAATQFTAWDTDVKGFGLRVTSSERVYVLKYRVHGEQRWFTIGHHGSPWTPEQARDEAKRLTGRVKNGEDPAKARRDDREAETFADLCAIYFREGAAHKKPSTLKTDRGRARLHLIPLLGKKRVKAITRADIQQILNAVIAGRTARKRERRLRGAVRGKVKGRPGSVATGGRGVGAQCVALASTILQFAVERGDRIDNPARGVKKPEVRKVDRPLSEDELRRLANSLDDELAETNGEHTVAAIRLLVLTGCRHGEIIDLQWKDVDLERRVLRLPNSKTHQKKVFLNRGAIEVLQGLTRLHRNPFVISGGRAAKPRGSAVDKTWARVRNRADLRDVRLHDLRHNFATFGAESSACRSSGSCSVTSTRRRRSDTLTSVTTRRSRRPKKLATPSSSP